MPEVAKKFRLSLNPLPELIMFRYVCVRVCVFVQFIVSYTIWAIQKGPNMQCANERLPDLRVVSIKKVAPLNEQMNCRTFFWM